MNGRGPAVKLYTATDEALADLFAREWDRRKGSPAAERLPAVMRVIREQLTDSDDLGILLQSVARRDPFMARRMVRAAGSKGTIAAVAVAYGVTSTQILGSSRRRDVTGARRAACWVLRNAHKMSLSSVAHTLGGLHHSTVLDSCRAVDAKIAADPRLRDRLLALASPPEFAIDEKEAA